MSVKSKAGSNDSGTPLAQCGPQLKLLRASRGWTLDELAERSGLSKAFLSRLEAGGRRPSIAAVLTLARVYDVAIGALFEPSSDPAEACVVIRGKSAPVRKGDGLTYTALSHTSRFANLQPIRLTIAADRAGDDRFEHEGEEWVYVLGGRVSLSLGDEVHELATGDAAHFDSRVAHRLSAMDGLDAEVLVVACPLPESSVHLAMARQPGRVSRQRNVQVARHGAERPSTPTGR